jgi:hypothetical protein
MKEDGLQQNLRKAGALFFAVALTGALVAPAALAKKPLEKRGGKKPIAEVVSFDPTTMQLALTLPDGTGTTQTVVAGVQVKVEHRGDHSRGKGHGNPSKGSLDDLVAGTKVLRMKVKAGVVTKLRLRRASAPTTIEPEPSDADEGSDDSVEDPDDSVEDPDDSVEDPDDSVDETETPEDTGEELPTDGV